MKPYFDRLRSELNEIMFKDYIGAVDCDRASEIAKELSAYYAYLARVRRYFHPWKGKENDSRV